MGQPLQLLTIAAAISSFFCTGPSFRASGQTSLPLDSLPDPPAELSALITQGHVEFVQGTSLFSTGQRSSELTNLPKELRSALDQQIAGDNYSDRPTPRLSAITAYRIEFRITKYNTWKWNTANRSMTIQMRAKLQSWKPIHTIWFRNQPGRVSFWDNPLVQHEFDHVKLSADKNMEQRFKSLLQRGNRQTIRLTPDQVPSDQMVNEVIDRWVEETFQNVVDLIDVRYVELDRITSHGRLPLPKESSLSDIIRPTGK